MVECETAVSPTAKELLELQATYIKELKEAWLEMFRSIDREKESTPE